VPEILEIERYRRLADRTVGRHIATVDAPDPWFLKGGVDAAQLDGAVGGHTITATRRIGKLLLLDLQAAPTLGLRFGMTGRLIVDDVAGIDELEYGSTRNEVAWNRFGLTFAEGGNLLVNDPRRLGGVLLDPDESQLGPDALSLTAAQLEHALADSTAPLKARLMDQHHVAGLGNLLTDEALWRAALDPARAAGSLRPRERRALHAALIDTLTTLGARGGSHTGDLHVARRPGAVCPRDGAPLQRRTIGGRTTYSCPRHQR
jgi:formamidopyrimidine-DNA glycosylase